MISNSIKDTFINCRKENRPALLTYIVAGDNNINSSLKILKTISKHADILELGFPHNTPIGDGGQIQTSSYRSIKNGFKIKQIFNIVRKYKKIKKSKTNNTYGLFQYDLSIWSKKIFKKLQKS